jgi:hypothetical protein
VLDLVCLPADLGCEDRAALLVDQVEFASTLVLLEPGERIDFAGFAAALGLVGHLAPEARQLIAEADAVHAPERWDFGRAPSGGRVDGDPQRGVSAACPYGRRRGLPLRAGAPVPPAAPAGSCSLPHSAKAAGAASSALPDSPDWHPGPMSARIGTRPEALLRL